MITRHDDRTGSHARQDDTPRRRHFKTAIIVVLVTILLVCAGIGCWYAWQYRPVPININGEQRTVQRQSTLGDFITKEPPSVKPGNYISINGTVLREGEGTPFCVTVNGDEVSYNDVNDVKIYGEEDVVFSDGADVTEGYDTETVVIQPKLEFQVMPGTRPQGVEAQHGVLQYVAQWGKTGTGEFKRGKASGETTEITVTKPEQNCVIIAQDIHPDNGEKIVALTFDDGPSEYTAGCMQVLAEHNVPAMFNIITNKISSMPSIVAEEIQAGHIVASHTWSHQRLSRISSEEIYKELADAASLLKTTAGRDCMYLRPPYGSMDERGWLASKGNVSASFYWTHDTFDWSTPGVEKIVSNCTGNMEPGSVILMHDGGGDRSQTIEALPQIIAEWEAAGYRFVSVDELMASDSSINLSALSTGAMPADCVWPTEMA